MGNLISLEGCLFGRLTVVSRAENSVRGDVRWSCTCVCGNHVVVAGNHLRNNAIMSCGCLRVDVKTTHGMTRSVEHTAWANMLSRCTNPKHSSYSNYGGRGITVCDRWLVFDNFFSDMGYAKKGLSLEREHNDKGYYKGNCKWATAQEQALNRRVRSDNSSGVPGVYANKLRGGWDVQIFRDGKCKHVGHFQALDAAIFARKQSESAYGSV